MAQISVNNLTFYYEGSFDNIFEDVSFSIDTDWKLGFIGRNGKGKTTFLNLLLGKYSYRGSISTTTEFDYFPYSITEAQRKLYIWDEPLNYIDVFSRMQIEKLLLDYQPTMLFVEHDVRFREKIATKTIELG